jgi:mannosyltransferase OCH1-like enzyme
MDDIVRGLLVVIGMIIIWCLIKLYRNYNEYYRKYFKEGNTKKVDVEDKGYIPMKVFKTGIHDYSDLKFSLVYLFNKIVNENPGFELEYYSDKDSRKFIENNYDKRVLSAYDKLKPGAYKADLFRYAILYKRGGIYSDLSQTILLPLNKIVDLNNDNLYLVEDRPQQDFRGSNKGKIVDGIQISFMASRPKNKIYLDAIDEIVKNCENNFYGGNPLSPTGPQLFKRVLNNYDGEYKIELVETGRELVYKNTGKAAIINRTKDHYKANLNNAYINNKHYSQMWFYNDIYNK